MPKLASGRKYFVAVNHKKLVSINNGTLGVYSTAKQGYKLEANISVAELCQHWQIKLSKFDQYMSEHFTPDEEAMDRIYREKVERLS